MTQVNLIKKQIKANNFPVLVIATQFSSVSLFNGISNFVGYFLPKPSLKKNSSDALERIAGGIRESIHPPPTEWLQ